jgi:hypothetical protein
VGQFDIAASDIHERAFKQMDEDRRSFIRE